LGGRDDLYGGAGNDLLDGGNGRDDLYGGAGNDTLDGGNGNDDMYGGSGADTFVFGAGRDTVEGVESEDRIELDADLGVSDFASLMALSRPAEGGDSILFDFGGGHTLLLEDVTGAELSASQFGFDAAPTPPPPAPRRATTP